MNPTQDPQQPQITPPTPAPQPFSTSPAPISQFTANNPIAPPSPQVTNGFGSGAMGAPQLETTAIPLNTAPKKMSNKKIILIIAGIIVVIIAVAIITLLVIKPGTATNGGIIGAIQSKVAPESQLTEYKGTAFSFSYPKTFSAVDLSKLNTGGSEIVQYSLGGKSIAGVTMSLVGAAASPYSANSTRDEQIKSFETAFTAKIPDTATAKDVTAVKTTYQGFEAFKEVGTAVKDGTAVSHGTALYVFGNKNLYILTANVITADDATIGAQIDTVFTSLKINE